VKFCCDSVEKDCVVDVGVSVRVTGERETVKFRVLMFGVNTCSYTLLLVMIVDVEVKAVEW
jgi:hypothetical protein